MNPVLLNYDLLVEFRRQLYKDCLTLEHLSGRQKYFRKIVFPDGGSDNNANLWGYVFTKDNTSYVLPASYSVPDGTKKERVLSDTLPVLTKNAEKIATPNGDVYWWITKPINARIKPERLLSLKEIITFFTSTKHENPPHQQLYILMLLSQLFSRANFAVSTPAGFGKDSGVEILGYLLGNCNIVENPSLAKLYFLCSNSKILAYNEILSTNSELKKANETLLLAAGAGKNTLVKRSRATEGLGEVIDISKLSLLLLYNDIDHYPLSYKFFDQATPVAVLDRFPRFRLHGRFIHKFPPIKDVQGIVEANYSTYVSLLKSLLWYKQNYMQEYHGYSQDKIIETTYRHSGHLQTLLNVCDVLCSSQEEFDSLVKVINESMLDYVDQLQFTHAATRFYEKLGVTKDTYKEFESFRASLKYFESRNDTHTVSLIKRVMDAKTYKEKLYLMESHGQTTTSQEDELTNFI